MEAGTLPRHVALIMDGNNRWARRHRRPKLAGHHAGAEALRRVIRQAIVRGVSTLSVFAFSSENWRRPRVEVDGLMRLFEKSLHDETPALVEHGVRIRILGDRSAFSARLCDAMRAAEEATADGTRLTLNVLANYGGRWHVAAAAQQAARLVQSGALSPEDITETWFANQSLLSECPDVDLLIRTGGDQRISNFLLWQSAYAELVFSEALWPDFDESAFDHCLDVFMARERRFGRTSEQVEAASC